MTEEQPKNEEVKKEEPKVEETKAPEPTPEPTPQPEPKPEPIPEPTKTTEPPKDDETKKSLDEIKKMMENVLKGMQKEDVHTGTKKEETKVEEVKKEPEETKPTGEKVELNFGENNYVISIPSEWDDVMVAKLKILIDEAEKTGRTLFLDKALTILEKPKEKKKE